MSAYPDPTPWKNVFSPLQRETEDLQLLQRLFARWCEAHDVEAAGLYAPTSLRLRYGAAPLPDNLEETSADWLTLNLPEGRLVYRGAVVEAIDSELLLLSAGNHIAALKHQNRYRDVELQSLNDLIPAIARARNFEEVCTEILERATGLLDAGRGALYVLEDGVYRLSGSIGGEARKQFIKLPVDEPEHSLPGAQFFLSTPIEFEGDPIGLLVFADKESRQGVGPFTDEDRRTLDLFVNPAQIALGNIMRRQLEHEMELAAEIQQQILPKAMPEIPGFEVIGWNRPARQVGGDYFDLRHLENGHWGLVVGDVTGKGMPAALLVSTLHSALRLLLDRMDVGPELIERLNRHIFESSSSNKFITMLLAALDAKTNQMVYLNAGHNPGLVLRGEDQVEHLSSAGLPLGLMPDCRYGVDQLHLDAGDLVCIYSDGITECQAPDEEEFGLERLIELLQGHRNLPLSDILRKIDEATIEFAQGQPQGDDQTIVLLRRS